MTRHKVRVVNVQGRDCDEDLPDGVTFENNEFWATCPDCGNQQADMGHNVNCEACGYGPMPCRSR